VNVVIELVDDHPLPERGTRGSACFDCRSRVRKHIPPRRRVLVPLGFKVKVPPGNALLVLPRSGLSRIGVEVIVGTVDSDYRGEVCALVWNDSQEPFEVLEGDRIAQCGVVPFLEVELVKGVVNVDTERGEGGFGSTGRT